MHGLRLIEQSLQGELGYVVKSPASGMYLRFRPAEARVISAFDGDHSVSEIAQRLTAEGLALSASAIEAFALKLATLGLVERSLAERSSAQLERLRQERKERRRKPLFRGELLRMRFSIGDPDALLERTMPWVRWCFTPVFVYASLVLFAVYALTMAAYWEPLTASFAALMHPRALTVATVATFWIVYIGIGTIHELGHAYACKHFSGSVNEMGFMILYFQPAFYCNVNDAWTFTQLSHRLWVTAAGGWIELWVAAIGAAAWLLAAPGTLASEVGMLTAVLAGGLALLTNANPLLPFDGYFALSDYLEIPNLRQRAQAYTRWFFATHLLRRKGVEPVVSQREQRIFLVYGLAAIAYLALVYWFLLGIVGGWLFRSFGGLAASGFVLLLLLWKRENVIQAWNVVRESGQLMYRARVHRVVEHVMQRVPAPLRGWRIVGVCGVLGLLLPWSRTVDGVWTALPADRTIVTTPVSGVVTDVRVREGEIVQAGALLLQIRNLDLERALPRLRGSEQSLVSLARAARARDAVASASIDADAAAAGVRADNVSFARQSGAIRATIDGQVITTDPQLLVGRRVDAGTPLLALGNPDSLEIRMQLRGVGTAAIAPGQAVSLYLDADAAHPRTIVLEAVSPVAGRETGAVEARAWMSASSTWRVGASGPARVTIGPSTVGGVLWWALRTRLSPQLLL